MKTKLIKSCRQKVRPNAERETTYMYILFDVIYDQPVPINI